MHRFIFFCLSPFLIACGGSSTEATSEAEVPGQLPRTGELLEEINGLPVTQDMLDIYLSVIPPENLAQLEQQGQIDRVRESMIQEEVLVQEAIRRKVYEDSVAANRLALAERTALVQIVAEKIVDERSTEESAREWYTSHLVQFRAPQAKVSHILVATEEEATALLEELALPGADFVEIAKVRSIDTETAAEGGEMGWLTANQAGPDLGRQIAEAEAGDLLGPIRSPGGFHVFRVGETREVTPFDDAKEQILASQNFKQSLFQTAMQELVDQAKGEEPTVELSVETPGEEPLGE